MKRIMGIDHGEARIGIALSDPTGTIASAAETVRTAGGYRNALARIAAIAAEKDVGMVVVGWPRNMNGTEGPAAAKVAAFEADLAPLLPEGVGIVRWDERLSTASVHRNLAEMGVPGAKKRSIVDRMAAQAILQNYLDSRRAGW
jgi:putative Holliday junction resolvase